MRGQSVCGVQSGNMFKKKKDPTISAVGDIATVTEIESNVKKAKKKRQREKCENCKRCWGFCDFLKTSWKLFKEFSADTSIHGIKYLTDKKLHWGEKLFWAIALTISIIACSLLIMDSFRKWQAAPVIVSFSEKFMNIWELPFAAVTICPIAGTSPLNENFNSSATTRFSRETTLKNFTGSVETRITSTKWRNVDTSSSDLFTEIATEEGFCWTFNMMNFHDLFREDVFFEAFDNLKNSSRTPKTNWELQSAYDSKRPDVYPRRASGSGENGGIQFEIWRKIAEVKSSASFNKGFKLVVHLPCEIPQFDKQYYRFPLEKSATLIIRPSLIATEDSLESYDFKTRQCYFEGEKILKLFKKYSRSNCELECLAEFTRRKCQCVHYSMPRLSGDKVCDVSQTKCYEDAKKDLSIENMKESLRTSETYEDRGHIACDCLPACSSLQYEGEISHDDIRYFGKYKNNEAFRSTVTIFFKDNDFIFSKRSELYSFTDFIANFGGILGLFLGVSILSIVEIIYFLAFRQLDDNTEHPSRRPSVDDDTIASVEIKPDETIVRNGY